MNALPYRCFSVGCAVWLAAATLASAEVTLKGLVGPEIIHDDAVIPRNTLCVLDRTEIWGSVRVLAGARLVTFQADIQGNIRARNAARIDLRLFTTVGGNVRGEGARSIIVRSGTRVDGNVRLEDSSAPVGTDALLVVNTTVIGNVVAVANSGLVRTAISSIGGNVVYKNNGRGSYLIRGNLIAGDIRFLRNRGPGIIAVNRVKGDLHSEGNSPDPSIANNLVDGDTKID
ncbi:MAG TPA: hypothetical protein VF258_07055 [Luteolibacter sp.]